MIPARVSTTPAVADLDDELAVAATTGHGLVAAARALRLSLRAVESWRADPGRAGCLCRAAEELRVALTLVDGLTPPRLRRAAVWTGPVDDRVVHPISTITRVLGRTARVLRRLARGSRPGTHAQPGPQGTPLDADERAQCRTAWENTYHALVRLRAVQEAETWFSDSDVDPWLLLAAESPLRDSCPQCEELRRGEPGPDGQGAKVIPFRPRRRGAAVRARPDDVG
ncbi:MAG: hypothetical protein HOV68_15465 [Streptomycetaceae bacterium]|nr:hypothetical protein [Streptomycetaceae bacterium]